MYVTGYEGDGNGREIGVVIKGNRRNYCDDGFVLYFDCINVNILVIIVYSVL